MNHSSSREFQCIVSELVYGLSYVILPFNVGHPFCLMDVSQWLDNLQPKPHKLCKYSIYLTYLLTGANKDSSRMVSHRVQY